MKKIKVLIVDDSALVRNILEKGLSTDPEIEVVGKAHDAFIARDKIVFKKPDVITLDVEMPRMDGVEFLKRLMPQYPVPVVMVSAMTGPGASVTLDALESGAIDYVLKPSKQLKTDLNKMMHELKQKVKMASKVDVSHWRKQQKATVKKTKILAGSTEKVIVIGASTGGTVAIKNILEQFPRDIPGTVIVQHMPPVFTRLYAERLDKELKVSVKEAEDGDRIITGQILIAPGALQTTIIRSGGNYIVRCLQGENVNGLCPSVDVIFDSAAEHIGPNAIGVLLTGMGKDGAKGLLKMKNADAKTIAQDEKSSIVFGMPKEAYLIGAVNRLHPLNNIPGQIISYVNEINTRKYSYVS